ncbi:MAG: alkaline phosphatase family protein [Myxococcaceae bacterium]
MPSKRKLQKWKNTVGVALAIPLFLSGQLVGFARADGNSSDRGGWNDRRHDREHDTRTPIKHVIVIIGENRSFDHIFATYVPRHKDETVLNLLSEGIVNADGTPGPNYGKATQYQATAIAPDLFENAPVKAGPYTTLPPVLTGGAPTVAPVTAYADAMGLDPLTVAHEVENGLAADYYQYLITGGTGLPKYGPDSRIDYLGLTYNTLPPGPYQLTPGVPYDSYASSPVHRFYQMRQQQDCDASRSTPANPSGCDQSLFAWVEVTIGAGNNGQTQTQYAGGPFDALYSTGEGSTALGFYNVQQGDAPYLKELADKYSMSDNYHQAVYGGTGANHVMMGTGDAIWFSDGNGNPAVPPENTNVYSASLCPAGGSTTTNCGNNGIVSEIENPDPQPFTSSTMTPNSNNNWYTEDGYGGNGYSALPAYGGGTYSNCSDNTQPGVASALAYLAAIKVSPNCEAGHYYLLNNYNPGYFGDGSNAYTDTNNNNYVFTIPPSSLRTVGDALLEEHISWGYFGDQFNVYLTDPYDLLPQDEYCNICNFEQYSTSIMTDAAVRTAHIKDTTDLYTDIENDYLPAVSFVKPSGLVDGHPASSKLNLFEGFAKKIVDLVKRHPDLWKDTAIFITFDESGGYWDTGYVQQLDYFGDGTRTPMIVVSPYTTGGHISHTYTDHVSPLKFIEYNWKLKPLTARSRDNFPNPVTAPGNPYVPINSPAIGDLVDMFHFDHCDL